MLEQQLRVIPFFRNLPADALEAIVDRLKLETFSHGEVVFRKGEPSGSMYVVRSGQVDVVLEGEMTGHTDQEPLASLGPGSFVGELGLLLDEPRSATLLAVTDSELLALSRSDLDDLLDRYPAIALDLSRELGRRLVATNRRIAPPALTRYAAVWGPGTTDLVRVLVEQAAGQVGVLVLPGAREPTGLPAGVKVLDSSGINAETIAGYRSQQVEDLDQLVIVLPPQVTGEARAAAELAEHLVTFEAHPGWAVRAGLPHRVLSCDGSAASLRRCARWVSGRAMGLALSSGGSKCVAHIGVLRVLREAGIEIDAVAGTSGGAIVAAGLAFDIPEHQMLEWMREMARNTKFRRFDVNLLPRSALFKGVKLRDLFNVWLGGRSFPDAVIPFWAVASDVESGEEVVIAEGKAADGLRASMSIPGAFNPWPYGGRRLIDGAVVNPMPASVLRDAGLRYVIGSTVAGQEIFGKGPGAPGRTPHLLQIMSRMLSSMEREMIKAQIPLVDVVIRPQVYAASSFDFSQADAFVAEGERAARAQLADIEALVETARR
ncbi:MAG: patatin-like phospholipase family protein [Acidimicrobiia bacterium]